MKLTEQDLWVLVRHYERLIVLLLKQLESRQ